MKIIYLYESRFAYDSDDERFGYNVFRSHGYDVEVWLLLPWLNKRINNFIPKYGSDFVKYIKSEEEFDDCLKAVRYQKVWFVCYPYHSYDRNSYVIRKKLFQYNKPFVNITESPGCDYNITKRLPIRLIDVLLKMFRRFILGNGYFLVRCFMGEISIKECKKQLQDNWYRLIGPYIYKSKYNFMTTELEYYFFPNIFEMYSSRNIMLHSGSYDEYLLANKNTKRLFNCKYVVFIDQGLLNRIDILNNIGNNVYIGDQNIYVNKLCRLFDLIEKKLGYKVIVAAHPKSDYNEGAFGKYKIVYGNTPNLIKYSEFVINQVSTALFLAMLYKKDFLDIYIDDMFLDKNNDFYRWYKVFNVMNCELLDISNDEQVNEFEKFIFKYNPKTYNYIKNAAIISDSSISNDKLFYECIYEFLDSCRI